MNLNLGMDFGQLAQVARPQMRGNAPVGGGGYAGADYSRQQSRYNNLLELATQQAQQEAIMKARAAEEEFSPEAVELRTLTRRNKLEDQRRVAPAEREDKLRKIAKEIEEDELRPIREAANAYAADGNLQGALDYLKANNVTKLRSHQFFQDQKKDAALLRTVFEAMKFTPKFAGQKELKAGDQKYKLDLEALKQAGANKRAALQAQVQQRGQDIRKELANAKDAAKKGDKVKTIEQLIANVIKESVEGGSSLEEAVSDAQPLIELKQELTNKEDELSKALAERIRGRMGGSPAPQPKTDDKFKVGVTYQDNKGNKAKYLGNGKWEPVK